MNKYTYTKLNLFLNFFIQQNKELCIKMNYFLASNNSFNNRKNSLQTNNLRSMNASCLFSQNLLL